MDAVTDMYARPTIHSREPHPGLGVGSRGGAGVPWNRVEFQESWEQLDLVISKECL